MHQGKKNEICICTVGGFNDDVIMKDSCCRHENSKYQGLPARIKQQQIEIFIDIGKYEDSVSADGK